MSSVDVPLAIAHSISWIMSIVETNTQNSKIVIDVNNIVMTNTESFLISSVLPNPNDTYSYHKSNLWMCGAKPVDDVHQINRIIQFDHIVDEKINIEHWLEYELQLYESDKQAIAAIYDRTMCEFLPNVLVFWMKDRLHVSNPGYGLGVEKGTYRFTHMNRVL